MSIACSGCAYLRIMAPAERDALLPARVWLRVGTCMFLMGRRRVAHGAVFGWVNWWLVVVGRRGCLQRLYLELAFGFPILLCLFPSHRRASHPRVYHQVVLRLPLANAGAGEGGRGGCLTAGTQTPQRLRYRRSNDKMKIKCWRAKFPLLLIRRPYSDSSCSSSLPYCHGLFLYVLDIYCCLLLDLTLPFCFGLATLATGNEI